MTSDNHHPARIALACQGGGAQTAFTAGVLHYLLYRLGVEDTLPKPPYPGAEDLAREIRETRKGDAEGRFEVVALSGTSGGAMCATLAWDELITRQQGKLEKFWLAGYPDGNAAARYQEAWTHDLKALQEKGHWPWLRVLDRFRTEFGLWMLEDPPFMELLPFHLPIEAKPYYFDGLFKGVDALTPPMVRSLLDAWRNAACGAMEPFGGREGPLATLVNDCFELNPLYPDSAIRREFDTQNLFRELLQTTLMSGDPPKSDIAAIRDAFYSVDDKRSPELLIGAVDVQHTHRYRGDTKPKAETTETESQALVVSKERLRTLEKCLEPDERRRVDHNNFKSFRGSEHLDNLIDCMLASAAIPVIMRGPIVDGSVHWDGLFSTNPPIYDLPDVHGHQSKRNPQQIWVIRINPMEQADVPDTPREIADRRNELAGNLALMQEIRAVHKMNGATNKNGRKYEPITFGFIDMEENFAIPLDYPSKVDRRIESLWKLYKHGVEQGHAFYKRWVYSG
jgi:predicted acylesterase/phospholipase RssA